MSPLANNQIAAPTLDLTSHLPAVAIALDAPEVPAPAATAAAAIPDAALILSAFSPATRRQLELTVNALSRSFRKAIRHAERLERDNAPQEEQDAAWKSVEHRSALLQDFIKSLALPTAVPTPEPVKPADAPVPVHAPIPATNTKLPPTAPETLPPVLATPSITLTSGEDALFAEHLAEFRQIRALPTSYRAERRRKERASHNLIKKINRQGDDFANRVYEAMKEIDAEEAQNL